MLLSADELGSSGYQCLNSNYTFVCPGAGYNEFNSWVGARLLFGVKANMTMTAFMSGIQRQLLSQLVSPEDQTQPGVAIATTLNHLILEEIGSF